MAPAKPTRLSSLLSKIHPPLPMNPRESRQLAKTISKSFRDHLDIEHPRVTSGLRGQSDAHLSSILSNPHFDGVKRPSSRTTLRTRAGSTGTRSGTIEQLQTFLLDGTPTGAIHRFRDEAASGEATLDSAKTCLRACARDEAYKKGTQGNPVLPQMSSAELAPGRVVANWLWSTGLEESMEFVYDIDFVELLTPRLCAEDQFKRVEGWLSKITTMVLGSAHAEVELAKAGAVILRILLLMTEKEAGLNGAMRMFKDFSHQIHLPNKARQLCSEAARRLAQRLAHADNLGQVDCEMYDEFLRNLPEYLHGTHLQHRTAWLQLRHPLRPDPDPALSFLKQAGSLGKPVTQSRTGAMIQSHLEVAEALQKQMRLDDAEDVMRILNGKLASLGNSPRSQASDEQVRHKGAASTTDDRFSVNFAAG